MISAIKKLWRYAKKYKKMITLSMTMIIIVQLMGLISPLIVKEILDNHLSGITETWYQVGDKDEHTITFKEKYYKQEKNFDEDDLIINQNTLTVVIKNTDYYVYEGTIVEGERSQKDNILTVKADKTYTYELEKLTNELVKEFFSPSVKMLIILVVLLFVRSVIAIIANFIQKFSTANLNVNIVRDVRLDAIKAIQRLPISYFESEPAGKVSARIIHDVNGMINLMNTLMNLVVNAGLGLVFAYIGMFILNAKLALLTFIFYPIIYLWLRLFTKLLKKIATKVSELNSLMVAQLNEIINGINILQIFNYHKQTTRDFDKLNKEYKDEYIKEAKLHTTLGWNMISLLRGTITALVVFYFSMGKIGIFNVGGVIVTGGLIYAYNEYILKLIDPVSLLFRQVSQLEFAVVKTHRIFKIIDGELEDDSFEKIPRYSGKIEFKNVYFSYKEGTEPVLKDINFKIEPGQMVGIVGHTGSGKSTMMSLLLRFYDLKKEDHGIIFLDGKDIQTYSKRTYRQHIGIILQDPVLFKGTIASNIRFGNPNITDQEAEEILIKIGGKHILDKFPEGINQEVSRAGLNLSLGEKQLISFARALVYDPAILVLDEATANIDTETEGLINKALSVVSKNRTTIVIAHRLSTIQNADKIIVLENGYKVEEGTHLELLEKNGTYSNIYRSQIK